MKTLKKFLSLLFLISTIATSAQNTIAKLLTMPFSKKVSFQNALIKVNNKNATYNELISLPDTSVLKIEVYSKKAAEEIVDKDEAKNGLVLVTLHKRHFPPFSSQQDNVYIIDGSDTIRCSHLQYPTIDGDTTNKVWSDFLIHSLKGNVPAQNGAPAGLYFVDIDFIVNKDSSVSDVEVLENPGYGTSGEVKRLMANSPAWIPAKCDDKVVPMHNRQRITFYVKEE